MPHSFLFLYLALHHIDPTWFVAACVTGSTKFSLWLTVRCWYPKLFTVSYALHKSNTTVDLGITYSCTTGNRVSASHLSTATKKPSFISVSSPPKTHWVLTTQPTLCLHCTNADLSISTMCPGPSILKGCLMKYLE